MTTKTYCYHCQSRTEHSAHPHDDPKYHGMIILRCAICNEEHEHTAITKIVDRQQQRKEQRI